MRTHAQIIALCLHCWNRCKAQTTALSLAYVVVCVFGCVCVWFDIHIWIYRCIPVFKPVFFFFFDCAF